MESKHYQASKHNPNVSVDCVIFGYSENQLNVLLIKRKSFPSVTENQLAIPGDLVYDNESLDTSAHRVLADLTNITEINMEQFYTFGGLDRLKAVKDQEWLRVFRKNPDARVISVGYYGIVNVGDYVPKPSYFAGEAQWMPLNNIPILAFDHNQIVDKALAHLRKEFISNQIGFDLLPDKFTLTEFQNLHEQILGVSYDKRNFRKAVKGKKYLVPLDEKSEGKAHRPARLYTYAPHQN